MNYFTTIEKAGDGNRNEEFLHNLQDKILKRLDNGGNKEEAPYYASLNHIITKPGVPYDATQYMSQKSFEKLLGKNVEWDFDVTEMLTENLGLFKGANHRFATLGHDPILGLIFGTANIMTNTITCTKKTVTVSNIQIPIMLTNHVIYTSTHTHPRIGTNASTLKMIEKTAERALNEPRALIAALIKQIIHIGTDLYTPCGIQIPGANLVLTNKQTEELTKYISTGDLIKVGASAKLSQFINMLISTLHTLLYKDNIEVSRELYNVRTRKIILYSNLIATSSNIIWVGGNALAGNESAFKQLDIGGLMVTLNRLITDTEYIQRIKEEFVFGNFDKMIIGDDLEIKEVSLWD